MQKYDPKFNSRWNKPEYFPKKPVKSFLDLEVYQKSLEAAVFVAKSIAMPKKKTKISELEKLIINTAVNCALSIPHQIAEAHSTRFGSQTSCLVFLEKVMLNCNKMVVYLEQIRDICKTNAEHEQFEELIKKYFYIRRKVLNLQRVWKKYMFQKQGESQPPAAITE